MEAKESSDYNFARSIEMREVEHKDAPLAFARILERNRTVTRVVLTDANAEVPEELGRAIQTNALLCIQILQVCLFFLIT